VRRFVYTSTPSVVFDARELENANEDTPYATRFLTPYAESKALAEREVLAANGVSGLVTVALRPHLIWGPGDPHLIPRVLARARAGKLKRVGRGVNRVSITHVVDAARAHVLALGALTSTSAPCAGRAYFIHSQAVELWPWIERVLALNGVAPLRRSVSLRTARVAGAVLEFAWRAFGLRGEPPMTRFVAENLATSHWFDITRARRDLGYEPAFSGEAALRAVFAGKGAAAELEDSGVCAPGLAGARATG
jgi:nucleoside-diphosphate-sugar epimerase